MTDDPVKRKKFEIPEEFLKHLESLQDQKAVEAIKELCKEVEDLVGKLGISDQCTAFVTDGDLAISWREYWTKERGTTKSVSYFRVTRKTVLDAAHRVHPSSCPGNSLRPTKITCIHLWTTWSLAFGFRSGVYYSTKTT
jgi:hypothetical protein